MARRKTRKVSSPARKGTRLRARSTASRAIKAGMAAVFAGVIGLLRVVTPSGESVRGFFTAAWHSRNVRRFAGLAGGVVVVCLLSWVMLRNLSTAEQYRVDPGRIELSAAPSWAKSNLALRLKADIEDDLRADLADLPEASAFDAALMETISERIERSPWVRRVARIERRFPTSPEGYSTLIPVLEVRTPAVAIETADRYILVDGDGVVLPLDLKRDPVTLSEFNKELVRPLRVVKGVEGAIPPFGDSWNNEQVAAALSMERVIRQAELDRALPIEAIELIGIPQHPDARGRVFYESQGGVVLVPDQSRMPGFRVLWGRPPVHASTMELSPNQKLENLKKHLRTMETVADTRIDVRKRG